MKIGIVKEIKNNENRVSATPEGVKKYINAGNIVLVETGAGIGSGYSDAEYKKVGAKIVTTAKAWDVDMVVKVKEPLKEEYKYMRPGLILYTYLHLAANRELTNALIKSKTIGIAYETMVKDGRLPLLAPMSRVAGRRGAIVAATHLEKHHGGLGILPGGVEGTEKGFFVIVGGGVAGYNAATTAMGLGTNVEIFEANPKRIEELKNDKVLNGLSKIFGNTIKISKSDSEALAKSIAKADAVISTILIPGALAKKIVTEAMVKKMKQGSVIVDIPIDQGGSVATVDRATTHDKPTYEKYGVIHYSVANMPGATPRTATSALEATTLAYGLKLAKEGMKSALKDDTILTGINTIGGQLTNEAVQKALVDIKLADAKKLIEECSCSDKTCKCAGEKPATKTPTKKVALK